MQDLSSVDAPQSTMLKYTPDAPENVCMVGQQGDRLWLENQSGRNMSLAVTVGSQTSEILPQSANQPTPLLNTVTGSAGAIDISVNGQSATLMRRVDPSVPARPEDVQVGMIATQPWQTNRPIRGENRSIPVLSSNNTVNLSDFLSPGVTEDNTEIDLVIVLRANSGAGAITREGHYVLDELNDNQLQWLSSSIVQNTIASGIDEASGLAVCAERISRGQRGQAISALRELLVQGKFYGKPIASWGGLGVTFIKVWAADNWLGVKQTAQRIGRSFAGAVSRGLTAIGTFAERIASGVDSMIDGWFRDFEQSLRQNDPVGHCALFCSNPIDQLDAWMRGFGGPGIRH